MSLLVPNNKAMVNDMNEHLDIPFINNMIENNLLTDIVNIKNNLNFDPYGSCYIF